MKKNNRKHEKYLGIDIGKDIHYAGAIDKSGEQCFKGGRIINTREGYEKFIEQIKEEKEKILIGMEPTGHYWKNFYSYLTTRGFEVVLVNSYHTKLHRELIDNCQRKTDAKDGIIISDLLRGGKYFDKPLVVGIYEDLRRLTIAREKIVKELIRAKMRLRTVLDEYLPEYEKFFCDLAGITSIGLLQKYNLKGLKSTEEKEFIETVQTFSKKLISKTKAKDIRKTIQNSIGSESGIIGGEIEVGIWTDQIKHWQKQLKEINKKIGELVEQTEEAKWMLSIKAVGKITAGLILGQTGSFRNYSNYKKIEKMAGLNLKENSSGKHTGQKTLSKRGRDLLRYALYRIAIVAIAKNEEMKKLFKEKVDKGKNKMIALTAISIKLLRIMFSLVKKQEYYIASA